MNDFGLVSIITPTYNCGRFIAETIESVLSQTYGNWEMLIVDDCSSDETRKAVEGYKDDRIKYHCLDKNSGAAIARNTALKMAKGRWIAFLDSDDLWKPEKLERQLKFMTDNDYSLSYHEYSEIDEEDNELGVIVSGKRKVNKWQMYCCCWPGCLSVMYDVDKIGLIQIEDIKKNNDIAMWLKVIKKANCHLLKENLAQYRRRKGSITPPGIMTRVKWHYKLFREAEKMDPLSSCFLTACNIIGIYLLKNFFTLTGNDIEMDIR